ncbi:uncharacterized protein LOC126969418 [Leptidea sinapis]|uniref:uncharacterized protein LOC126969418 n=1 Tax=Leptidea sinapis TaxID=189913 RepID=UPI0021344178|nr:uncharacterized protein LOC126969418 [Leptidea sinapis]
MSFVNLATLAMHRRSEMEERLKVFNEKCDQVIHNISKLKMQASGFAEQLNCEPSALRERFLSCMKQLDEYTYLITDINLSVVNCVSGDVTISSDMTPVHDSARKSEPVQPTMNLMDALSEPIPSTSRQCMNPNPVNKPLKKRIPKDSLIVFSSTSCSSESVQNRSEREEEELSNNLSKIQIEETLIAQIRNCKLPAQELIEVDKRYQAVIMHADGGIFWIIIDTIDDVYNLMKDLDEYYTKNQTRLTPDQRKLLTYCAYYDHETKYHYRALLINICKNEEIANLYLLDTGEYRSGLAHTLQPLAPQFSEHPPFARSCHLAGIEISMSNESENVAKIDSYVLEQRGKACTIIVDDNTSESLGVFVFLESKYSLNNMVVEAGWARKIDKNDSKFNKSGSSAESDFTESAFDITHCPEFEDPVVAVTGYHNRDEADICKHYKGGPEKTCFKGLRCTKKHIVKNPDGWTLDRVAVAGKCPTLPLPEPGTWIRVTVTHVAHFNRFYVQILNENELDETPRAFGKVVPPTTLTALVREMNSDALLTTNKDKNFEIAPAIGELVAAVFPTDGQWYRGRVLSTERKDHCIEVMYIDYGNTAWLLESQVRILPPRYVALPEQAVGCVLAGVACSSLDADHLAAARLVVTQLISNLSFNAQVISRSYKELTLELIDGVGRNVAEELAKSRVVELVSFSVEHDTDVKQKLVVP